MRKVLPGILVLLALLLASCTSFRSRTTGQPRLRLFPNGIYQHEVTLILPRGETQSFKGVVSLETDQIRVVGLSPVQTTLFRLVDNLGTGKLEVGVFIDALKEHEDQLRQFYLLLRKLLLLPAKGASEGITHRRDGPDGLPLTVSTSDLDRKVVFFLDRYDERQIPLRIRIERDPIEVEIKVTGYDL